MAPKLMTVLVTVLVLLSPLSVVYFSSQEGPHISPKHFLADSVIGNVNLPSVSFSSESPSAVPSSSNEEPVQLSGTGGGSQNAFVVNYGSASVSIIGIANNTLWKTVGVGDNPHGIASSQTNVYIAVNSLNEVSVMGVSNYTIWKNISVGDGPEGVIVSSKEVYVANEGAGTISVIGLTNNTNWKTITVGTAASLTEGLGMSSSNLYVSNNGWDSVSVIGLSNYTYWKNITTSPAPNEVAVSSDEVYVSCYGTTNNGVLDIIGLSNNTLWKEVAMGTSTSTFDVAVSDTNAYVTNYNANDVSLVGLYNNTVWKTISVGTGPLGVTLSSTNVYISNQESDSISVIGLTNNTNWKTIAVGTEPQFMAISPSYSATDPPFEVDGSGSGSSSATLTTSYPNNAIILFFLGYSTSAPTWTVSDTNGLEWTQRISYQYPGGDYYLVEFYAVASSTLSSDTITPSGATIDYVLALGISDANTTSLFDPNVPNPVTSYVPSGTSISATITTTNSNDIIIAAASSLNGATTFTAGSGFTLLASGSVTANAEYEVTSAPQSNLAVSMSDTPVNTWQMIVDAVREAPPPYYPVYFNETGLPASSPWYINITSFNQSGKITSSSYSVSLVDGSYSYTIASGDATYAPSSYSGSFTVNGAVVTQSIAFHEVTYGVTFTQSGLTSGTWYVNVTTTSQTFPEPYSTSSVTFNEPNGTYSYTISTNYKTDKPSPSSGSFTVNGAALSEPITFSEVTYSVTFTESGLSSGTWYLNVSTTGQDFSEPSTTTSISFSEPNGTYSYTVATGYKTDSPSPGSGSFTVNGATVSQSVTFSAVTYTVTFTESGLPSGTKWYANITGQSSLSSTGTSVSTTLTNGSYTYSIGTPDKTYSAQGGSFTVNGGTVSETVTFNLVTYSVTFTESGLPSASDWNVTLNGVKSSSTSTSISFNEPNGSYSYTIGIYQGYSASPATGTVTVNGGTVSITITFTRVTYTVTFTESGLPSSTRWYLNITGQSSLSSTTGTISLNLPNGTYSYAIATGNKIYAPSPNSGSFTLNGTGYSGSVTFNELTWTVTFTETGLPSSVKWYANVTTTGQGLSSTSTTISVAEPNGTYSYSIATGDKIYAPSSYTGSFTVNGAVVAVSVTFHEVTYAITFTQTGLPSGNWYVNVSSTSQSFSEPYSTSSISFNEINGTYSFTVQTNYKIYAPSVASGTFTVNGAAVSETITFNEVTYAITFTESGLPSSTKWFVNITSGSSYSSTASSITLPEPNGSYSYSIATGDKQYSPSPFSGGITVNGSPVSESVTFSLVTFEVTYTESGLPAGTKWYLNISGQSSLSSTGTSVSTYEPNGTYAFTIATGNKIYNPNPSSGSFTVNGSAVSGTVSFSEVIYLVTFKETGLPSSVTWYINVTGGGSYSSATTSLSFHDPNGTYSFTTTDNNNKYRASSDTGSFTVNGASLNVSVPYVKVTYNVTFSEAGLPFKSTWYVILNGSRESSNTSSITFSEFNGSYSFTVQEIVNGSYGKRYVDFSYTGSRNVTGKVVIVNVTYATQYYLVISIIPVNGGTVSPLSGWYNSSAQVKINASAASSYIFESWSGTGSGSYSGQINPNTVTMNGPINETASFEKTYAVTFTESGLPSGITWYLNVSGPTGPRSFHSSLDSITFHGQNGTYSYSLGTNTRYATSTPTGQIIVSGENASANATFHLVTYTVDFIEIGLPSASLWSVSLNGTTSVPTNASVISFTMPNGTYPYSVAPLSGVVIEPNSGNVVVIGQNVVVDIVFKTSGGGNGGNLVSFIESGLPANGEWFVTLNGYTESSFSSLIQFYVGNGTYPYSISTTSNAKVSPDFGNVTVTHNMEVTVIFSNSTSSPGSSTTTIVQKISDNLGLIIGSTAASIIIGWVLAIYVNPENRKRRSLKRETRKGAGHR